jgi:hypothetical protein
MFAAAEGKSNLGIPKKVGKEFADADAGGKLPEHVEDKGAARRKALYTHPRSRKS